MPTNNGSISVLRALKELRKGIPVPTYPAVKGFLKQRDWFNGRYGLAAQLNGSLEKFSDYKLMWFAKQRSNRWLQDLMELADQTNGILTHEQFEDLVPKSLQRNYHAKPWEAVEKAFDLFIWLWTAETNSNLKIIIRGEGYYPLSFGKYLPPSVVTWTWLRRCKDEHLANRVTQAYKKHYLQLVRNVATRMAMGFPRSVELLDLVNDGAIGMIDAFQRYDPTKGIKFETFAVPRIRGAILDKLRKLDWVPRSTRAKERAVELGTIQLTYKFGGRIPTMVELAEHIGLTYEELTTHLFDVQRASVLSLDEVVYPEDDNRQVPRIETVKDDGIESPLEIVIQKDLLTFIAECISVYLTTQESSVITMYYWEEMTLKNIGEVMDISESRVTQIHTKALFKLRQLCQQRFGIPRVRFDQDGEMYFIKTGLPPVSNDFIIDMEKVALPGTFFHGVNSVR